MTLLDHNSRLSHIQMKHPCHQSSFQNKGIILRSENINQWLGYDIVTLVLRMINYISSDVFNKCYTVQKPTTRDELTSQFCNVEKCCDDIVEVGTTGSCIFNPEKINGHVARILPDQQDNTIQTVLL